MIISFRHRFAITSQRYIGNINVVRFGWPSTALIATTGHPLMVSSVVGMVPGDKIEVMLDEGSYFPTTIVVINPPNTVHVADNLPSKASTGNFVTDLSEQTKPNIG